MARCQQQALIEAPVEDVWAVISDPGRFPEWAADSLDTTGYPTTVEKGSTFEQESQLPLGRTDVTTFKVVELDDMHEIKLQCQMSGYYSHWKLTEAQGQTFADVELGVEPIGVHGQMARLMYNRRVLRETLGKTLDGLKRTIAT